MAGPVRVRASRRARAHTRKRPRHLYSSPSEREAVMREFEERYGKRGKEVYGKTVGKVRREQVSKGRSPIEQVKRHVSRSRSGKREIVRAHPARIRPYPKRKPRTTVLFVRGRKQRYESGYFSKGRFVVETRGPWMRVP